jgi:hypothetical protein
MEQRPNPEILVGIVTLNRRAKLEATLQECSIRGFHRIVVLDNGSTDGTADFLRSQPHLHAIVNAHNEGGSSGFNRIMRYFAESTSAQWLLLFDDDAYPTFSELELRSYLAGDASNNRPAYAFKVTYPGGGLCEMNRPGVNILDKSPLRAMLGRFHVADSTGGCLVDFASFVGILLRRETVMQSGWVSKQFFLYSDDTYYTLGISSRLGGIWYCPRFALIHDCNRSSRRLLHHDPARLMRDVANKIVLIREYSRFRTSYVLLYIARLILQNPSRCLEILRACRLGVSADLELYRNEQPC